MLQFASQWNTNSRNCHVAQFVLNVALTTHTPDQLLALPNIRASLEALLPYTGTTSLYSHLTYIKNIGPLYWGGFCSSYCLPSVDVLLICCSLMKQGPRFKSQGQGPCSLHLEHSVSRVEHNFSSTFDTGLSQRSKHPWNSSLERL